MTKTDFIISTMEWSFSRLNSFKQCPYEWKAMYIDCEDKEDGFFSEYGSFCHSLLEKYFKGKLSELNISQKYEQGFDKAVPHEAPPNKIDLRQSYYDKGLEYFNNLNFDKSAYEILGVEKKVSFKIDNYKFVGFIDLLLKDKTTGEIIIVDHKSSTLKFKKNGEVSKTEEEHFKTFKRQLYLYSIPIIKKYSKVDKLRWNLFKMQKQYETPWDKDNFEEAIMWAKQMLFMISIEKRFAPNPDFYYCNFLCSQRNNCCPYRP